MASWMPWRGPTPISTRRTRSWVMRDEAVHEEKALEIFEELGDLSGISLLAINLGVQAYADGRWDDAISMYAKAQEVSRRSGNSSAEGAAAANLGEVLISRGQLDDAETVLNEARRVLRGQKVIGFALFAETQLARLMMERGESRCGRARPRPGHRRGEPDRTVVLRRRCVGPSGRCLDPGRRSGARPRSQSMHAKELAGEDAALYEVPLERLRAEALIAHGTARGGVGSHRASLGERP